MINKIGSGNNSKFYLSIIYTVSFLYCNGSSFSCYDYVCFLDGWVKYYDVECLQYVAVVVIAESERNEWWNIQDGPV